MKKVASLAVLMAGVLLFAVATDAGAECAVGGWILNSYVDATGFYIYVGLGEGQPVYCFLVPSFLTGAEYFRAAIPGAQAGYFYVWVTGDAESCPLFGEYRWAGTLTSLWSQY